MLSFILLTAIYWIYCMVWFMAIQKPVFALFNRRLTSRPVTIHDIKGVYVHGAVSDAVIASYLSATPLLAGMVCTMIPGASPITVLTIYNSVIAVASGLLATADTVLYSFWKSKIDASVFMYLRSLKGATASVSGLYLILAVGAWAILAALFFAGAQGVTLLSQHLTPVAGSMLPWWGYPAVVMAGVAALGVLFIVTRGLGVRPRNPSVVYFSSNLFLNHWALNPGFQMIYSLTTGDNFKNLFQSFTQEECISITAPLFPTSGTPLRRLLRTQRPNILLIEWESFAAGFSSAMGGKKGVTPCFDSLADEGVLFTRCYAGGFRTDRGIVCINSGYPAQPSTSLIRYTRKLPSLPGLAATLRAAGYNTTAAQGGDLSIMHKSDYYLATGHDRLIGIDDFPTGCDKCKWGLHDGPVMQHVADEMLLMYKERQTPFFLSLLTISSHEPFEVPYHRLTDKIDNAFAYTDHALGQLVERLRHTPLWDDLLIVIVADHGVNLPRPVDDHCDHSHIPLLLAGGAVDGHARIDTIMSQTDIPATLLGQMGLSHTGFKFSRDILADTYTHPFGFHVFQNGAMMVDQEGHTSVDTQLDRVIDGTPSPRREREIKAILQAIHTDIASL